MQQQPQDPSQGAYPRFDQPGQPPAFSIPHSNPYNQQNNPYPQQNQSYMPPSLYPQYGMPGQQPDPNYPKETNLLAQVEVQEIETQLSSGVFACYNCWLYFVVFYSMVNIYQSLNLVVVSHYIFFILAFEAAAECAYAITMINAIKNKSLEKVELGMKLAIAVGCLMFCCFALPGYFLLRELGNQMILPVLLVGVLLGGYFMGVFALPVTKIKELLERRETALAQNSNVSPYNVASPYNA